MSQQLSNDIQRCIERIAALEAVFSRPMETEDGSLIERVKKLEGELKAMKARMGKQPAYG